MSEHVGNLNEEMASAIIVNACQALPKTFSGVHDHMHNLIGSKEPAPKTYSILCGSFAEFYIRPLNTCIADTDFLVSNVDELAFSGDFPVLPNDMSGLADTIVCYEIESMHSYPGFVRLRVSGAVKYNWKYKKYEFKHTELPNSHKAYISLNMTSSFVSYNFPRSRSGMAIPSFVNGPAMACKPGDDNNHGFDGVESMWCPQWPREAQNWSLRPRNYGWPTTDTISEVLQNGCHVVYVQHRSCRDDELQWRLSFSVAEVILLQSWTQIQQIVYHMLRIFAKRELIQNNCSKKDEVLCPYHIKTLMLWTCEEMSPEWWNFSSVISICCELLRKLSDWLNKRYCPNYFIPDANLFYEQWNKEMCEKIKIKLNKFCNSFILSDWLVENYIQSFTRTPIKMKEVISGKEITLNCLDFILYLFESRKANESESLNMMLYFKFTISHQNSRPIMKYGFSSGLRQSFNIGCHLQCVDAKTEATMSYLPTIQKVLCFTYYDNLLHILHAAYGIGFGEISWESSLFAELIKAISMQPKIIKSKYHNFPKTYNEQSNLSQFMRAQDLMKNLTGSNGCSEFQLVSLMSKNSLRKSLDCECLKCRCIAPAALAYLAALHFVSSENQQAIRLSQAVFVDQTSQKDKETLNAGCLLFIDDVARIVGLCMLHQKITDNGLHYIGRRLYLDLRLSPEVFANYLCLLSGEKVIEYYLPDSAFPMDEYFRALIKLKCAASMKADSHFRAARQSVYRRIDWLTEVKAKTVEPPIVKETVINILMEYALENIALFYSVFRKDFGIECSTFDCYRALYLFKCGQYNAVLHSCERILHESDVQNDLKKFAFANVLLLPPLDSFFDADVQSLLGFHTLFYYLSPLNDEMRKFELTNESTFAHWFALEVYFLGMQLSASISDQNYTKCYYFLGRHFLARYLKIRCCIECKLPLSEAMAKFAAQKTNLPFEHIIRRYILQKLRIMKK